MLAFKEALSSIDDVVIQPGMVAFKNSSEQKNGRSIIIIIIFDKLYLSASYN